MKDVLCGVFKNRQFVKSARGKSLSDSVLLEVVAEMARGLTGSDLGGYVFKKRVPAPGRGKRRGYRTIIVYKAQDKAFFVYAYQKGQVDNISQLELEGFRKLAVQYLGLSNRQLRTAIQKQALAELMEDSDE